MKLQQTVTRALGRKVLLAKKNSPHIFFAAGVVGVGVSTVMACRATLKLEAVLDEIQIETLRVKDAYNNEKISDQEQNRLLALKYARGGVKIAKLYLPAAVVGSASVALLTGSHVQLTRRNSALSATLALVSQSFNDYRDRVRAEIGDAKESEIYNGVVEEEVDRDGKKVRVKSFTGGSPYARKFSSQTTAEWHPNVELNRNFVQCQQNYANHKLQATGHVMLNDVYDMLGLERSSAGAVVGWVLDGDGDNYIDFGIYSKLENAPHLFGDEYDLYLDFNVDGEVFHLIDKKVGRV